MTLNEVKKVVAESDQQDAFNKRKLTIKLPHINYHVNLEGIVGIYDFFLRQEELFKKHESLPPEIDRVKRTINNIIGNIITYIQNPYSGSHELNNNLQFFDSNSPNIFLADTPEFDFLVDIFLKNNEYYAGAFQFLTGRIGSINSKPQLVGYLMAYEFFTKNTSLITERKNAEKKSISTIRNDFQESLSKAQQQLTGYLAETKKQSEENAKTIVDFRKEKENEFYKWYDKAIQEYDTFTKNSEQKIKEFEELYKEKLKLEAPAKYWNERANKIRIEGRWWLGTLIASCVLAIVILIWTLNEISIGALENIFQKTSTAVKWSVVYITLLSFLAFAIRIFSKMTFSSFHLVRDAEEREQLTYVYLALQKEKGIDQTERHLIMQSLFSRSDSGLLKEDGGPTMPGQIIDQATKK